MKARTIFIVALVALVNLSPGLADEAQRTEESCDIETELTVVTGPNATGHWRTALQLARRSPAGRRGRALRLHVRPLASVRRGVRTEALAVVIQGPSPEEMSSFDCTRHQTGHSLPPAAWHSSSNINSLPPAPGYERLEGFGWYKVHRERVGWREAQAACAAEAQGAHLAVIESPQEARAVRQLIRQQAEGLDEWLNVGYYSPNSNFVTVFGAPLTSVGYQRWASGEPNMEICGHMHQSTLYYDGQCDWVHASLCEYSGTPAPADVPLPLPPEVSEPSLRKPLPELLDATPGYENLLRQGRKIYYKVHAEEVSWWKAKALCERENAHLVVINSQSEADILRQYIARLPERLSNYLHIGVRAVEHFVTLFGDTVADSGYDHWESEQPDDERCVVINHDVFMFDGPCSFRAAFICEQRVV